MWTLRRREKPSILFSVILEAMKRDLEAEEIRELEFHLSNLQLNFVEKMRQLAQE